MPNEKTERNDKIVEMSKTYNMQEIADCFGITRERVRQVLNQRGISERHYLSHESILVQNSILLGTTTDTDIAEVYGVLPQLVSSLRNKKGIKKYKIPIGCPDCVTHHYARGLCKACWARAQRRGVLSDFNLLTDQTLGTCRHDDCNRRTKEDYCWQHKETP
jgi:hypothetical protein